MLRLISFCCLVSCSFIHLKGQRPATDSVAKLSFEEKDRNFNFASLDIEKLSDTFARVLAKEGYQIELLDKKAGKVVATLDSKNALATFNSGFTVSSNYKVSDSLQVRVNLTSGQSDIASTMIILKKENYSMGENREEEIKDPALYRDIYTKVKHDF